MTGNPEPEKYPEVYDIGAYWGPRKEPPEECARRAGAFLELLAPCDPFLSHWYKPAKSQKDRHKYPLTPPEVSTLTELFRRGVNRERGGPAIEELGFRSSFSNGGLGRDYAFLSIRCGMYSEAVSNSCLLSVPRDGPNGDRILTTPVLTNVVRSMVAPFDPDWALATSSNYRMRYREPDSSPFSLGWITYLSRRLGRVPPLPAPVRIEPVEDKGMLIVLTPERFTVANPDHVALAQRVRELLARAGLLPS